jgi:hypothetical protein
LHHAQFNQKTRAAGRRQAPRVRLALPGKVILVTGHEPCQVDDLSQTGACLSLAGKAPPIGCSAVLMVGEVEAFGAVIWRRGARFGLCFDEPLAKDDVVRLRAIHDHYGAVECEASRRQARDFIHGRRV